MKKIGLIAGTDQDKPPKITNIATTLDTVCGRWKIGFYKTYVMEKMTNKIKVNNATDKGFQEVGIGGALRIDQPESKTRRGRVQEDGSVSPTLDTECMVGVVEQIGNIVDDSEIGFKNPQRGRVYSDKGLSPSLSTMQGGGQEPKILDEKTLPRIRKLTPKECFRLQGFPDEYFARAESVNSDSQLYKQAGNSVTVNVIFDIARRL